MTAKVLLASLLYIVVILAKIPLPYNELNLWLYFGLYYHIGLEEIRLSSKIRLSFEMSYANKVKDL